MIRVFNKTDLSVLHRMIAYTIDVSYSHVYPPRAVEFFKKYHSKERIKERNEAGLILVLIEDSFVIGTGSLLDSEIIGVFVHPCYQGLGFGKALMAELEKAAKKKLLSQVNLSISIPSKKFYEHLGYTILSEKSVSIGEGQYLTYWEGQKILYYNSAIR